MAFITVRIREGWRLKPQKLLLQALKTLYILHGKQWLTESAVKMPRVWRGLQIHRLWAVALFHREKEEALAYQRHIPITRTVEIWALPPTKRPWAEHLSRAART